MACTVIFRFPRSASDLCFFVLYLFLSVGSDDSEDSDFERSDSSAESGISEELSESEKDGKRRKTR